MNLKPENQKTKLRKLIPVLLDWFSNTARDLPWRRTRDPYAIWVSEIMLQQTQVKTVLPFWERWMRELPTVKSAAGASSDRIHKLWEGLGYYTRARNLQKAAQIIVAEHGGKFPSKFEDILALPGIGRYTAGAISSIAFNQPAPILDGNVMRVLARIFGIDRDPRGRETNELLWRLAAELVGKSNGQCSALNQSLMELGALVCLPRNPQCAECPVKKLCMAFKTNRTAELPKIGKRVPVTARRFVAFLIEHRGKYLVRQRPEKVVNAHLWEFPNVEINGGTGISGFSEAGAAARGAEPPSRKLRRSGAAAHRPRQEPWEIFKSEFGFRPPELRALPIVKHSITRYRITLEAYRVPLLAADQAPKGLWLKQSQFDSVAFTAAHKKLASFEANRILIDR